MFAQVLIVDISVFAFHLSIDIKTKYSACVVGLIECKLSAIYK